MDKEYTWKDIKLDEITKIHYKTEQQQMHYKCQIATMCNARSTLHKQLFSEDITPKVRIKNV
ncbi:hypothetical protein LCGC14_2447180 [marine sediment metagenome]|uniref:Uncharacterized protein n=1 Tax=marine sediment metagenome TaxID=412755 RepID=A0A0F9BHD1_9ZZZZ